MTNVKVQMSNESGGPKVKLNPKVSCRTCFGISSEGGLFQHLITVRLLKTLKRVQGDICLNFGFWHLTFILHLDFEI